MTRTESERSGSRAPWRGGRSRAAGSGVAVLLALAATTACDLGDAGFAPSPPGDVLLCSEVGQGQTLEATGSLDASVLTVRIRHVGDVAATIVSAEISGEENATFLELRTEAPDLVVVLDVGSPPSPTGRFTVTGDLQGSVQTCPVQRTFIFTISDEDVEIT